LIEITAIQAEQVRSFDEARTDVLDEYRKAQADQVFADQVERLANLTFEHPESLDAAAQALGVEPATSDFFSRSGDGAAGIGTSAKVRAAAFSGEVLEANNNSALIELDADRALALRVVERTPSRARTLDEVREQVRATLRRDALSRAATQLGERVLEALRAGSDMQAVAQAEGLLWDDERGATRDDASTLDAGATGVLFKMPAPQDGVAARFAGVRLSDGGYGVLALLAVRQVERDAAALAQLRTRVATALESGLGEQGLSAVMRALRKHADVEVLEKNLRGEES
jgi:peptidyl-prolyl cis-trans isomerase D